jgi:Ca-activated chloride channel homolog
MPGLLAPLALALTPLLGVIVALYLLKVRREDRRVPSTLLWRGLTQDPPADAPWQRLRPTPLLLLQLLALALLIAALARPFLLTDAVVGRNLIVLLDRSASMGAGDVAPSRLEAAKRDLAKVVDSAGGARLTVIAFDDDMTVLAAAEGDPGVVRRAVSGVTAVPVRGDITDALVFADALARGQVDAQIVVYSDGNFHLAPGTTVGAALRYVPVGTSADNQAVSAVSVTERAADGEAELFAQVVNLAGEPVTRTVEVDVDGTLYDARDVALPAGGRESFVLALPDETRTVAVRLTGTDALALDDAAWAVRTRRVGARVALVSPGNRFLDMALGLLPSVASVTAIDPSAMGDPYGLTDVAVLDGVLPDPLPPGNLLVVDPVTGTPGVGVVGTLQNPVPRMVDPGDPLVAGTEFDQVSILAAAALELGPEWTPVVVADVGGRAWPLIARGRLDDRAAVVIAFDLRASDLPLRPAFPLVVAAAVEALAPSSLVGVPASLPPGDPLVLRLPPGTGRPRVTDPTGRVHPLTPDGAIARFGDTGRLGIYTVAVAADDGEQTAQFAVNLGTPEESDVRPRAGAVLTSAAAPTAPAAAARGRRELWWPLGVAALGVLVAEWGVQHRRSWRGRG